MKKLKLKVQLDSDVLADMMLDQCGTWPSDIKSGKKLLERRLACMDADGGYVLLHSWLDAKA